MCVCFFSDPNPGIHADALSPNLSHNSVCNHWGGIKLHIEGGVAVQGNCVQGVCCRKQGPQKISTNFVLHKVF